MKGSGILLLEDDSVYEGNFTQDLTFVGKVSTCFLEGGGMNSGESISFIESKQLYGKAEMK